LDACPIGSRHTGDGGVAQIGWRALYVRRAHCHTHCHGRDTGGP
jgi:organic radical activating enzyme